MYGTFNRVYRVQRVPMHLFCTMRSWDQTTNLQMLLSLNFFDSTICYDLFVTAQNWEKNHIVEKTFLGQQEILCFFLMLKAEKYD